MGKQGASDVSRMSSHEMRHLASLSRTAVVIDTRKHLALQTPSTMIGQHSVATK